jgi:hypothetical protein
MKVTLSITIETDQSLEDLLELAQDFGDSLQGDFDPDNAYVEIVDERTAEEAYGLESDEEAYEQYVAEFAESQSMGVDTGTLNYSYCPNTSRYIDL